MYLDVYSVGAPIAPQIHSSLELSSDVFDLYHVEEIRDYNVPVGDVKSHDRVPDPGVVGVRFISVRSVDVWLKADSLITKSSL